MASQAMVREGGGEREKEGESAAEMREERAAWTNGTDERAERDCMSVEDSVRDSDARGGGVGREREERRRGADDTSAFVPAVKI